MTSDVAASGGASGARILDRRYQRYTGPRKGQAHATRRLAIHAFQRLVGLRRPARFKIIPIGIGLLCYVPAIAFVGISALVPGLDEFLSYSQAFSISSSLVVLFIVIAGPSGLIADRRSKSLSLYLASPLDRNTYLFAHFVALVTVLCAVTIGPTLLFLTGNVVQGVGPDGVVGVAAVAGKIVLAGGIVAVYFTLLTMGVASLCERGAQAGGALFLLLNIPDALVAVALIGGNGPAALLMLAPGTITEELARRIIPGVSFGAGQFSFGLATPLLIVAVAAWAAAAGAITWYRYHRLDVNR